jgi:cytochrome c-type biogenesis protein CcmF
MEALLPQAQPVDLLFGRLGNFFISLAFIAAALSAVAYFLAGKEANRSWMRVGRSAYLIHGLSVLGIVAVLFAIIFGHHFEYHYAWQHSSTDLPLKYILSCFWEGQEGSFLLWTFWHAVLGAVLIVARSKWEARLLSVFGLLQVTLLSFLLGIHVFGQKIGNTPFLLLSDVMQADPVFLFDDYMRFIQDGTGLNALLQNYWMVIHPPVLFLGFASAAVPFAFAWSALRFRDYKSWITPALPWSLFAVLVLGAGILMGGRWAYESLSFGGFWAWDPVENASLVPWLVLVGGTHLMVSWRATGRALRSGILLVLLSYWFVLLSTYLTRSGVLGDTSVHSFVDAGLARHLVLFLVGSLLFWVLPLIRHWRAIPAKATEEAASSREFWMFLGSLVLLFAALQIITVTSIPAINTLSAWINGWSGLGLPQDIPTPANPEAYYNAIQLWVAVGVGLFMGIGQLFRYRSSSWAKVGRQTLYAAAAALVLTALFGKLSGMPMMVAAGIGQAPNPYYLLLFAGWFALTGNAWYLITGLKGKLPLSGGSLAHAGFGIMLVGILISGARQQVLSENTLGIDYGEGFDNQFKRENILLYAGMPQPMGDYLVTYLADSTAGDAVYYHVQYERLDASGEVVETFVLEPYLLRDKKTQQLSVSAVPNQERRREGPKVSRHNVSPGDTVFFSVGFAIVDDAASLPPAGDTLRAGLRLRVFTSVEGPGREVVPQLRIVGGKVFSPPAAVEGVPLQVAFSNIKPDEGRFEVTTIEPRSANDWIILKAIIFPHIRLVWFGSIVLFLGIAISIRRRQALGAKSAAH